MAPGPKRLAVDARRGLGPARFALAAVALGIVAGLGAYAFRALIGFFHDLLFLGRLSAAYDTNVHTPAGPWGLAVALVPVVGALGVVFLVRNFAPEARGHGVPEVMDAVYYHKGVIRPVVAVVKAVASALSIGSGGSVGREGPIIQIGAAFASWFGRVLGVSRWQLVTLVAAGGGAGIAATFNTPIGGVLFAVEVLMHEVSVRTLVPVALATATATFMGQYLFGDAPAFAVPELHMSMATNAVILPAYVALGAIMALVAVAFIRSLYAAEDAFERAFPRREYLRHVVGMFGVGLISVTLMTRTGHYYVEGVGYATILDVLTGALSSVWLLLLLFALKLAATSLTLGSGASGGIFSPSLFMGATVGGAFGIALRALLPGLGVDPTALALAGMAGLVAGATGAALTAIVMIFEMTRDYSVVLPMTLTVAVAYGLRQLLLPESIYTMKLARRGHFMPRALQANAHLVHHVAEMVVDDVLVAPASATPAALDVADPEAAGAPSHVVLVDGDRVSGVISRDWALAHPSALRAARALSDVAAPAFVTVAPDTTIFDLIARMQRAHASVAVVVASPSEGGEPPERRVAGVITKAHLAEVLAEGMEMFED